MSFTRSQRVVLIVLGLLTLCVIGSLVVLLVWGMRQAATMPGDQEPSPQAGLPASTATPTPTATPSPTPTPTPIVPQTRYDLLVALDPLSPTLRVRRGYAYIELRAYSSAIDEFNAAIGLDTTLTEAYVGRGEAYFRLKGWSAALADFDRAIAVNPRSYEAYAWRGHLLAERGECTRALEDLRQAVTLNDMYLPSYIWLGRALACTGDFAEAKATYTMALLVDSNSVEAYVGRALANAELNDLDAAQSDLFAAQDVSPYNPEALNGQAWLYVWYRHERLADAERLAQRAIAAAQDDLSKARYLHTLGWIYYEQGRYADAVAALEEASALATVEGRVVYGDITRHLEEARQRAP